eukprot:1161269-Pelagomonas_calceolata.AAC.7
MLPRLSQLTLEHSALHCAGPIHLYFTIAAPGGFAINYRGPRKGCRHGGGCQHVLALHASGSSSCSSARDEGAGGGTVGRQEEQGQGQGRALRTPKMKRWRQGMSGDQKPVCMRHKDADVRKF